MDRLGDLSRFDGHTPGPWNNEYDFPLMENRDIHATEWSHEPNRRLALSAPDLLAALKESRKEVEELRGNARRAKTILQEEIESIEQEDGGRGCVTAMIDAIVELEGKQ